MRNRMIKKEFWHSHRILSISPNERLLFISMFNVADDEGVLKNSDLTMKSICFSCDSEITLGMVQEYIKNLIRVGLLVQNIDGSLLKIKKWHNHQRIDKPTPSSHEFIEGEPLDSKNTPRVLQEDSTPKEKKGIEKKEIKKKVTVQNKAFELFYSLYPRKQDKKRAEKAFSKLNNNDRLLCMQGVEVYIEWLRVNGITDKKLIKLPTTYINGEHWNDELNAEVVEHHNKVKFKLDATGNSVMGWCSKCNVSDFYDPYQVNNLDSRCCDAKLLPSKKQINNEDSPRTYVKLGDIMSKYK